MNLLPNATVIVRRHVGDVAVRKELLDPWDDPEVEAADLELVADYVQCSLHRPAVFGEQMGGTRQQIEWRASFDPTVPLRVGDIVEDVDSSRVWTVLTAHSRTSPAGGGLDHIATTLRSVRGLTDGLGH